jgi:flagellar FliL protein
MAKKEAAKEETKEPEGEVAAAEGEAPKKGKKKIVFIAGGLVVVLIVAGVFLSGMLGGKKDEHAAEGEHQEAELTEEQKAAKAAAEAQAAQPVYYELPEFLVNLNSTTNRTSLIKMSVTLELRDVAAVAIMDAHKPRIQDTFVTYLRELRPAELQGSQGIHRLRVDLLARLNATIEEGVVKDILFGEIVVQ